MHNDITAVELQRRIANGEKLNILDVREEIEYHTFNIGGKNIPLHAIQGNQLCIGFKTGEEIIVVCSAGLRSATAARILAQKGYTKIFNLSGGLLAMQRLQY